MRDLYTVASTAAKDLVKIIGKSDDEFANLAKSLGKSADELADDLFKKIGKNDDVNSKNIKVAIQNLDVGGDATKKAARKAFAESIDTTVDAKYFTWTQAAQAAGATGGFSATVYSALSGANKAEQSNATPRKITKVEYYQDNKDTLLITFDPPMKILVADDLVISGSATDPSMDGPCKASISVNDGQIVVAFNNEFKTITAGGEIKVTTTVANQAADIVGDAAKTAGTAVGGVVGGVGGGIFSGLGGAFGGLFGSGTNPIYVIAGCCCCILIIIIMITMR
jgi:hypothetical protein